MMKSIFCLSLLFVTSTMAAEVSMPKDESASERLFSVNIEIECTSIDFKAAQFTIKRMASRFYEFLAQKFPAGVTPAVTQRTNRETKNGDYEQTINVHFTIESDSNANDIFKTINAVAYAFRNTEGVTIKMFQVRDIWSGALSDLPKQGNGVINPGKQKSKASN